MSNSTDVSHDPSTSPPVSPTSTLISTILSTPSTVITQPGRTTTSPISTVPITTSTTSLLPTTTSSPSSTSIPLTTSSIVVPITTSSIISIPPTTSPSAVTSTITVPNSSTSTVVISTSITLPATSSTLVLTTSSTSPSSAATSTPGSLSPVGNDVSGGGLSTGGKIAIAVVIPIVVVALLVIGGLFLWRRRKQQREAEDLRRKELEDYGYNPNNDPTVSAAAVAGGPAGAASAFGEDQSEMRETNGSGYRGWGGSSTGRKAPTTIGSRSVPDTLAAASVGGAAAGLARTPSDHWNRDGFANGNGNANGNGYPKESSSSEQPLMPRQGSDELVGRTPPATTALEGAGAGLGAGYAANQLLNRNKSGNKGNLQRGVSNASSGYDGARSDISGEYPPPTQLNAASYFTDSPYPHIPPQDFTPAPVVQDVNARRNTKIESPNIAVHRGEPGIAQNF